MKLLVLRGADYQRCTIFGFNGLHFAVQSTAAEPLRWLLELGARCPNTWATENYVRRLLGLERRNFDGAPRWDLLHLSMDCGITLERSTSLKGIKLPPWSPATHFFFAAPFRSRVRCILLVWNRLRLRYRSQLPRELVYEVIEYMATDETLTTLHPNPK